MNAVEWVLLITVALCIIIALTFIAEALKGIDDTLKAWRKDQQDKLIRQKMDARKPSAEEIAGQNLKVAPKNYGRGSN